MVYSVALRYAGDPAAAMDISQEVFVKLMSQIGGFREEASFESWLYRLVVNCCLDHKRRLRRLAPLLDDVLERVFFARETLTDDLARSQTRRQVQAAVARLEPDLKIVVVLRYTKGLSYEEIAEALGCPKGTVASRLNRAHKELARKLSRLQGEDRKHD